MPNTLRALVHAIRPEAREVISLELRPAPGGEAFPPPEAGAHIDLHLPNGMIRSYSLCRLGHPQGHYVVGVLKDRASRGGSRYVHESLRVGMTLPISVPRNNFRLVEDCERSILIAGGIGITPIFAMLQRLSAIGLERDLIYCARSREEAPFAAEIEALAGSRARWHFDNEAGGPPQLQALLRDFPRTAHFYCCGPAPMLDAYQKACFELGYENVHLERFAAPEPTSSPPESHAFEVELTRSGLTLQVPADKSILKVLLEAGVEADYSCEEGICGTCEVRVLEGEPDHRDLILSDEEKAANSTMMICVSRATGRRLVLDR